MDAINMNRILITVAVLTLAACPVASIPTDDEVGESSGGGSGSTGAETSSADSTTSSADTTESTDSGTEQGSTDGSTAALECCDCDDNACVLILFTACPDGMVQNSTACPGSVKCCTCVDGGWECPTRPVMDCPEQFPIDVEPCLI
jgi:hypothetical protein